MLGQSWQYSGGGYTVMQLLLTEVANERFPDVMSTLGARPARDDEQHTSNRYRARGVREPRPATTAPV